MLIVISPAKTLDFETRPRTKTHTVPDFLEDSRELVDILRGYSSDDIAKLMNVSDKIATLNRDRFQDWRLPFTPGNAKQAILAFKGDVYTGLNAGRYSEDDFLFAQDHLRILSGLYGLLRPLDLIQPYRLEMGTRLENARGKSLYDFWGDKITQAVNNALAAQGDDILINLASQEYFSAIRPQDVHGRIVTPAFKEFRDGEYKIVSFYAKKARGLMTSFIIRNRLSDPNDLREFKEEGYAFTPVVSTPEEWVFSREGTA